MANQDIRSDDEVLSAVLQRSATDLEFRQQLLSDPVPAIESVIGVASGSLAHAPRVQFFEKSAEADVAFVLPDYIDPEGSLSESELEAVAGGDFCITSCTLTITVCQYTNGNECKPA